MHTVKGQNAPNATSSTAGRLTRARWNYYWIPVEVSSSFPFWEWNGTGKVAYASITAYWSIPNLDTLIIQDDVNLTLLSTHAIGDNDKNPAPLFLFRPSIAHYKAA